MFVTSLFLTVQMYKNTTDKFQTCLFLNNVAVLHVCCQRKIRKSRKTDKESDEV